MRPDIETLRGCGSYLLKNELDGESFNPSNEQIFLFASETVENTNA